MCRLSLKTYFILNGFVIPITLNAGLNSILAFVTYKDEDPIKLFAPIPETCVAYDILITSIVISTLTWIISGLAIRKFVTYSCIIH